MFQANAAASVLDLMMPQAGVANKSSSGDPGAFSQQFEKQVKNISNGSQGNSGQAATRTNKSTADSSQLGGKTDQQAVADGGNVDESGNILPQLSGVEDDLLSEAIRQVLESPPEAMPEEDVIPVLPLPIVMMETDVGLNDELEEEDTSQLLRDILRQRAISGLDQDLPAKRAAFVLEPAALATVSRSSVSPEAGSALEPLNSLDLGSINVRVSENNDQANVHFIARHATTREALENAMQEAGLNFAQSDVSRQSQGQGDHSSGLSVTAGSSPGKAPAPQADLPAQMILGHSMQQDGWDQAMGQRVVWMVRNNIQEAQIQLNPQDLGSINVRISVNNDQANVHFVAQHATTREALENAMPRLREMMQEAGLNLAQSDVSRQLQGQGDHSFGWSATAASSPATAPAPQASLPAHMTLGHPMQQKGWDQAMGQRVVWMVRNNMQEAQIQLNPRDLGPINVRISVNNDQANVHFVAQHASTREALENAMPRLREMMQEAGLNLAQSDVSRQSQGQGDHASGSGRGGSGQAQAGEEGELEQSVQHTAHMALGGVDFFA